MKISFECGGMFLKKKRLSKSCSVVVSVVSRKRWHLFDENAEKKRERRGF